MARIDNLNNFLTDVADAIRAKSGSSGLISAEDFDTAITNIPTSGGDPNDYFDGDYAGSSGGLDSDYFREKYVKAATINFPDINCSGKTTLANFYRECLWTKLPKLKNTSSVTNMSYLYYNCRNLQSVDVSQMDTSSVTGTGMEYMFENCTPLQTLDVSNFDFSKITSLGYTFYGLANLNSLNLGNADTPLLTNMTNTFTNCFTYSSSPFVLDLSKLDLSKVTSINSAFLSTANSEKLSNIIFPTLASGKFFSNSLTDMQSAFSGRKNLTSIRLEDFDTSNVTRFDSAFRDCIRLEIDDTLSLDLSSATSLPNTFTNCERMKGITLTNISNDLYLNNTFTSSLRTGFSSGSEVAHIKFVGNNNGKNVSFSGNTFGYCCNVYGNELLLEFDGVNLNHQSQTTSYSYLTFRNCYCNKLRIKGANIIRFNVTCYASLPNCQEIEFEDCDFSNCVAMYRTFYYASQNLKRIKIPGLTGIESGITFSETFFGCTGLELLDIRDYLFSQGAPNIFDTTSVGMRIPDACVIVVKDDTEKAALQAASPRFTNIMTVAEYEAQ